MADEKPNKPYPPRWLRIYVVVILLAAIVWITLVVLHGGTPWSHPW
ncbi:MAG: hypothetical protein ACM3ML_22850 [Micromonosporaceae bacterium]